VVGARGHGKTFWRIQGPFGNKVSIFSEQMNKISIELEESANAPG
jgi:hypothetical protein